MIVTKEQLKQIATQTSDKAIGLFLPFINKYAAQYEINTPQRMAAYLAQVLHESEYLKYTREIWGPTAQQKRYERDFNAPWGKGLKHTDRNYLAFMLGNAQVGDGSKLRGYGLIMITGRTNMLACSIGLFGDDRLLKTPELLSTPEYAVLSSMWFWKTHNVNKAADTPGAKDESLIVNGGTIGLENRELLNKNALEALA